jgi:glycosyltransferase involved in cell wall biosynthesis
MTNPRTTLSVVIPAYNEASRLPASLERLREFARTFPSMEVLVVDDGSRDATAELSEQIGRAWATDGSDLGGPMLRVLRNPGNRGKGWSVRHGMLEASGEWLLFTDADLSTPIEDVSALLEKARQGFDVVIGSRALRPDLVGVHQSLLREGAGKFFNVVMRVVLGLPFRDTQCGFKLVRQEAAREIFSRQRIEGFGFDAEVLYLARKLGFQAAEMAVRWNNAEGTKVGMLSGLNAFADLLRIRWWDLSGKYAAPRDERSSS